jgi:hypothetical protein
MTGLFQIANLVSIHFLSSLGDTIAELAGGLFVMNARDTEVPFPSMA